MNMGIPVVGGLLEIGAKLIDRVLPDKTAAAEAKLKLLELQQNGELAVLNADLDMAKGQMEINKVEAGSDDKFTRRWRPAMGWCCVAIFACNYIAVPLLAWVAPLWGLPPAPRLDMGEVLPVLLGMLGLGSLRTIDKRAELKAQQ